MPNTKGVELSNKLDIGNDLIIHKNYPNSFRETNLQTFLEEEKITELIICGAMTHMCVESTVRAGFDLGYQITLAFDAVATKALTFNHEVIDAKEVHLSCMAALNGMFCNVKMVDEIKI